MSALALLLAAVLVRGDTSGASSHYQPYRFLVGEWSVGAPGAAPMGVIRFRFGPGESYLWFSMSMLRGDAEQPHFEGMLLWNGARKNLDMLVALDLVGGNAQEQGTVSIEPDGSVLREISATYSEGMRLLDGTVVGPGGATRAFRQRFTAVGVDRIETALTRKDGERWVPTFPGSDRLVMIRRAP
jgi:hypothetical protein